MGRRFPNLLVPSDGCVASEDSHTIYRLNIIGDNGIEWRINVDPRLTAAKN